VVSSIRTLRDAAASAICFDETATPRILCVTVEFNSLLPSAAIFGFALSLEGEMTSARCFGDVADLEYRLWPPSSGSCLISTPDLVIFPSEICETPCRFANLAVKTPHGLVYQVRFESRVPTQIGLKISHSYSPKTRHTRNRTQNQISQTDPRSHPRIQYKQ